MNLSMRGIYKSFGANDVLKSVDFHLSEGEICALLGENGAGKSTLMNILGGVLQPDQGTIALDGAPVPDRQVLDGALMLDEPGETVFVGLRYTSELRPMPFEMPMNDGHASGRKQKLSQMHRVRKTSLVVLTFVKR